AGLPLGAGSVPASAPGLAASSGVARSEAAPSRRVRGTSRCPGKLTALPGAHLIDRPPPAGPVLPAGRQELRAETSPLRGVPPSHPGAGALLAELERGSAHRGRTGELTAEAATFAGRRTSLD